MNDVGGGGRKEPDLPLITIINYNVPTIGVGFMFFVVTLYLMKFSTDVLLISPAAMGLIFGLSRIWDACTDPVAGYLFEVGFGLYPNRHVMDGHFSVARGDRQVAFHASRRAPRERDETRIGPLSVEIIEPMRRVRVHLAPGEEGIECDLLFTAASIPHEEPQNVMYDAQGVPKLTDNPTKER